jgi:hypothetical protein
MRKDKEQKLQLKNKKKLYNRVTENTIVPLTKTINENNTY